MSSSAALSLTGSHDHPSLPPPSTPANANANVRQTSLTKSLVQWRGDDKSRDENKDKSQDDTASIRSSDEPPSIPLPSPLNDPAWLEFVESTIIMSGATAELPLGLGLGMKRPRNNTNPLPFMANEFTHLRSNSSTATHRPSLENLSLGNLPKMHQILTRRNPKSRLAQQHQQHQPQHQHKRNRMQDQIRSKRASVELIAEQYSKMLDYKDRIEEGLIANEDEDEDEEEEEDLPPPPVPEKDSARAKRRPVAAVTVPTAGESGGLETDLPLLRPTTFNSGVVTTSSRSRSPAPQISQRPKMTRGAVMEQLPQVVVDSGDMSPQSDCTLVSFEEDVIYFKPISLGPSPPSSPNLEPKSLRPDPVPELELELVREHPPHRRKGGSPERRGTPTPPRSLHKGNRQLDIGLDLLHGELSSSLARGGCPRHHSEDRLSDLQLTIMIDAYENLRVRTSAMDLPDTDRENMGRMFESWVSTLHNIRGSLATRGGLI